MGNEKFVLEYSKNFHNFEINRLINNNFWMAIEKVAAIMKLFLFVSFEYKIISNNRIQISFINSF